jgi:hypothetical protein
MITSNKHTKERKTAWAKSRHWPPHSNFRPRAHGHRHATGRSPRGHHRKEQGVANSTQTPSCAGKKALIGYVDPGVSKQLKQMALDPDRTVQDLLTEALNYFFQKHSKATIA